MRLKFNMIKLFSFTILVLGAYLFLFYVFYTAWLPKKIAKVKLSYVILHLDLKGAPPKLSYLNFLLPMLKDNGVNGLLIEYEDMFPYEKKLANLSATNSYHPEELKKFLSKAVLLGFEIIPLIQTFGHLEFALKLQEFKHLREEPGYPDSICPSNIESKSFIWNMLRQVINFHNDISPLKYIHLGCDEVYHLNTCNMCRRAGLSDLGIFLKHIKYISDVIKDLSPETTVLIWDDMLRKADQMMWQNITLFSNIEPVYWEYSSFLRPVHLQVLNYHKKFKNIWAASAFKGADGPTKALPNLRDRLLNHFSWMTLLLDFKISGEHEVFHFKGIILTGWSRYTHMAPLCELLPAAIPSLILNLRMIKTFKTGVNINNYKSIKDINTFYTKYLSGSDKHLRCQNLIGGDNLNTKTCSFEGNKLYFILKDFSNSTNQAKFYLYKNADLFSAAEFYINSKFSNMNDMLVKFNKFYDLLVSLETFETQISKVLQKYYSEDVINEYVHFKTYFLKKQLINLMDVSHSYIKFDRVWKRGPPTNFPLIAL